MNYWKKQELAEAWLGQSSSTESDNWYVRYHKGWRAATEVSIWLKRNMSGVWEVDESTRVPDVDNINTASLAEII